MNELETLVKPVEGALAALWSRYDNDRILYDLEAYVMKQIDGAVMPKVVNVTLNAPQTFADKVISVVSGAISQIVVEGDSLKEKQPSIIENCLTDVFAAADERLSQVEYPLLNTFHAAQFTLRGKSSMRIALRMQGDEIVPDIVPFDSRYLSYDATFDQLRWFSALLRRNVGDILEQYPKAAIDKTKTEEILRDLWTGKEEITYINDAEVSRKPHPYGYPPAVTQICNRGSFLMDDVSMVRHGESAYAANRGLYGELNRVASILATLALGAVKPALQKQVVDESTAVAPGEGRTPGVATVVPVTKGYEFLALPTADMNRAVQTYWSILQSYVQQGSISMTEYGNVTFPLSAVALKGLAAKNDSIYLPEIQAMAMLYQKASRMIVRQLIDIGVPIKVSVGGMRKVYDPSDLEGEYKIGFKFYSISPEEEIANYSIGAAARSLGLSQDSIFRNILKLQDPEGEMRKRASEDAEGMDIAIKLYRQGHRLIDSEDYLEAELTLQALERVLEQRNVPINPSLPQVQGEKGARGFDAGADLVPLLGGRAKVAAQKLPQGEENV